MDKFILGEQDLCARDYVRDTTWYPGVHDILPQYYPDLTEVHLHPHLHRLVWIEPGLIRDELYPMKKRAKYFGYSLKHN